MKKLIFLLLLLPTLSFGQITINQSIVEPGPYKVGDVITIKYNINAGSLGAIVCEGVESGKNIRVNVGSGFSDEQRSEIWSSKDVIGKVAEIRADAITQNQDGTYSLRFPRFITWRGFGDGEKI